jgi:tetratricopeptide (TPR) repeat protein
MGHVARSLSTAIGLGRGAARLLAVGAVALAGVTPASAQTIWDDPAFALYRQALEAMDKKDYARAAELAGQAAEKHPAHVLAHYVRGQAAAALSKWEDAASAFGKAAEIYPQSFAAHRDHGISLEQLNRLPEAAAAYERALAVREQDDLRARLAFTLIEAGEEAKAFEHLRRLADRNSTIPEVWSALGRLHFESGELAESEKAYAQAAALKDDGRIWFNLAAVRMRLTNTPGAVEAFKHAAQHAETKEQAEIELKRLQDMRPRDRIAPIDRARGTLQYSGPGR